MVEVACRAIGETADRPTRVGTQNNTCSQCRARYHQGVFDELRTMAIFATTVEAGSFRGAAKTLGLSASVVSHHVAQLEARLDVALLYRSTRRIALTDAGTHLFAAAKAMMSAAEEGLGVVAEISKNPVGKLSVAAPAALCASPFIDGIAAFAKKFPQVHLTMLFSDAVVNLVGEGIDVAFRAGTLVDSSLKSKKLYVLPRSLIASPEYLAKRAKARTPQDLASWDWIRLRSRPARHTFTNAAGAQRTVEVSSRLVVDSAEAMLQLALRGLGLATVPSAMAAPFIDLKHLVEVVPQWRLDAPNVYAVWPANAPASGLTLRLVSFLEAHRSTSSPGQRTGQ